MKRFIEYLTDRKRCLVGPDNPWNECDQNRHQRVASPISDVFAGLLDDHLDAGFKRRALPKGLHTVFRATKTRFDLCLSVNRFLQSLRYVRQCVGRATTLFATDSEALRLKDRKGQHDEKPGTNQPDLRNFAVYI